MREKSLYYGLNGFLHTIVEIDDIEEAGKLMGFMFTIEELHHLSGRVDVVRELLKGEKTQRQIASEFNVSIMTITRGSNALKRASPEYRKFLYDMWVGD